MKISRRCAIPLTALLISACASQPNESANLDDKVPATGYRAGTPSPAWQAALKVGSAQPDKVWRTAAFDVDIPIEAFFFSDPETVCDPDERSIIQDTLAPPWNANCRLIIDMGDGARAVGTGWLLGPRLIVTAGHCVHEGEGGKFYSEVEVIPAANGADRPFGSQKSRKLRASDAWKSSGSLACDYGAIILDEPFAANGVSPANHALRIATDAELREAEATVSGYPADKPTATQWRDSDPFSHILPARLRYRLDTAGGQSGSAVMHAGEAVGIHNYGGCPNYATRITTQVHRQLLAWLDESNR